MGHVIKLTPIGIFDILAYNAARYGFAQLTTLLNFLGILYAGYAFAAAGRGHRGAVRRARLARR
jgi:Na+/H+-dicarboxylate symporter